MSEYLVLVGGALLAAVVSGATGFGFALTATAIWMQWLPPQTVVVLCVVFGLALNVGYLPHFWRDIDPGRIWPFIAGGFVGVPLGVLLLRALPTAAIRAVVGVLLVAYAAYALFRGPQRGLALAPATGRALDGGVGLAGGFFGGLGGLSGFLPALWCGLRGWEKSAQRGTVQAYILVVNVITLAWFGGMLEFDAATGRHLLAALPAVVVGGVIGLRVFRRFDTAAFNRTVLWTLLASGVVMIFNSGRTATT